MDDEAEDIVGLFVPIDPGPATEAGLGWQPIRVDVRGGGLTLGATIPGLVELFRPDGTPVPLPASITPGDDGFLLRGAADGSGHLVIGCESADELPTPEQAADSVPLRVHAFPGLAGQPLAGYPHFDFSAAQNPDSPMQVLVDPARHADRMGLAYDAHVVAHRSAAEWAEDSLLEDLTGTVEAGAVGGSTADSVLTVWDSADAGDYDVVLDFGAGLDDVPGPNGRFDPGDLISSVSVLPDPAAPGPLAVATYDYDGGTVTVPAPFDGLLSSYDVRLVGRVVHPDPVPESAPLVVFLHGNHTPLYWPDPFPSGAPRRVDADLTSDENYRGFTYLQELLASHGYVTMSMSLDDPSIAEVEGAFGGAFPTPNSSGIRMRGWTALVNVEAMLSDADVGGATLGRIDVGNLHLVGHSRGGEAALQAFRLLTVPDARPIIGGAPSPLAGSESWAVGSVTSFSPVTFITDTPPLGDVPFLLVFGKADGDVNGFDDIVRPFVLYDLADGPKQAIAIEGANHNWFNTSWPCSDADTLYFGTEFVGSCEPIDPAGANLIGAEAQREIAKAYLHAFLLHTAEGDDRYLSYFERPASRFRPPSVDPAIPIHGQIRGSAAASGIHAVDDFETQPDESVSSSGQAVSAAILDLQEVHFRDDLGLAGRFAQRTRGALIGWSDAGAILEHTVAPEHRDFTAARAVSVRIAQQPGASETTALAGDMSVTITLVDEDGAASSVQTGVSTPIPDVYPSIATDYFTLDTFVTTIAVMKTLRFDPLWFVADGSGIDLTRIDTIRFEFLPSATGRVGFDDLDVVIE